MTPPVKYYSIIPWGFSDTGYRRCEFTTDEDLLFWLWNIQDATPLVPTVYRADTDTPVPYNWGRDGGRPTLKEATK